MENRYRNLSQNRFIEKDYFQIGLNTCLRLIGAQYPNMELSKVEDKKQCQMLLFENMRGHLQYEVLTASPRLKNQVQQSLNERLEKFESNTEAIKSFHLGQSDTKEKIQKSELVKLDNKQYKEWTSFGEKVFNTNGKQKAEAIDETVLAKAKENKISFVNQDMTVAQLRDKLFSLGHSRGTKEEFENPGKFTRKEMKVGLNILTMPVSLPVMIARELGESIVNKLNALKEKANSKKQTFEQALGTMMKQELANAQGLTQPKLVEKATASNKIKL